MISKNFHIFDDVRILVSRFCLHAENKLLMPDSHIDISTIELYLAQNPKAPWYIHNGYDHIGMLLTLLLLAISAFSAYAIQFTGWLMLLIFIPSLVGVGSIRYARLNLYVDGFEIVKKSLLPWFSDRNIIFYKDIKRIEFSAGTTDWNKLLILASMGKGSYGGSDKVAISDKMIVETYDNNKIVFLRFGSSCGFTKAIELIQGEIRKYSPVAAMQ